MKHLLFILACLFASNLSAQQQERYDLQHGEKYKVGSWNSMIPLGKDQNHIYYQVSKELTYKAKKGFTIAKFDFQNRFILENEIELTGNAKKGFVEFYNTSNDSINLIYSFKNKDQKKTYFFRQTIDPKTLQINNNEKVLCEVEWASIKSDDADNIKYKMYFSADSSKILLTYSFADENNNNKCYYGFAVLNQDFTPLWNYKGQSQTEEKIITISDAKVSNEGVVYLGVNSYKNLNDFKDMKHSVPLSGGSIFTRKIYLYSQLFDSHIFCFKKDEEPIKYNLLIHKKHIKNFTFEPIEKGKLLCAGFYTAVDSYDVEGNFTCVITPESSSSIEIEEKKVYDDAFIKIGMSEKEKQDYETSKQKGEMFDFQDYRFKKMINLPNGEYVIVAERYFQFINNGSNNMGAFSSGYHYSMDIFALFLDKNGLIKTVSKIPKYQFDLVDLKLFPNKTFDGFQCSLSDDKLYFVFNKIDASDIKTFMKLQKLVVVTMDMDGKYKGKVIPAYEKVESNISIDKGTWINDHTLGVYGFINATYKICPITLKIE